MKPPRSYSRIPTYSLIALTLAFCLFTLVHERYAAERAYERLVKHAMIISDDLWNLNNRGAAAYLKLAAEADHYERLEVVNNNGEIFQEVATHFPTRLEQMLIRMKLIPRVVMVTPVRSETDIIGWIEALWIPRTLAMQSYVLLFFFMIWVSITLYCRIIREKQLLEKRVVKRTNALAESNRTLQQEYRERMLAEKQRESIERQLEQSRKMESLGLLAGGVAHDLNNVLSGIVTYPDLILHDLPPDSPQRKNIETIRNAGLRAADIVQDLLTLARRGVVTRQQLDLNELVRQFGVSPECEKIRDYFPDTEIVYDLETALSPIKGSPTALKKVIMNLVSNGAEAQAEGGTLLIETRAIKLTAPKSGLQSMDVGEYVRLRVRDNGEGIGEEDLNRIFEPFYTRKVMGRSGTGLGLTVVWGTVEDHEGAIDVSSRPGEGTTIDIYLPANQEEESRPAPEEGSREEVPGSGQTILIIDDVDHQREIATAILERLNYRVESVESGEAALEFLRKKPVELVVLDMILVGGMDGLDTYKKILELYPGQKAIIASGFSESDRVLRAQALGAGSCIRKPYTLQQLSGAVQKELADRNRKTDTS